MSINKLIKIKIVLTILIIASTILFFAFDKGTTAKNNVLYHINNTASLANQYWGNNYYGINIKTVGGIKKTGLTAYAPSLFTMKLHIHKAGRFFFEYGVEDQAITKNGGVIFSVFALGNNGGAKEKLFSDTILPLEKESENKIRKGVLNLEKYKNQEIILLFETSSYNKSNAFCQAFWSNVIYSHQILTLAHCYVIFSLFLLAIVFFYKKIFIFIKQNDLLLFSILLVFFAFVYLYFVTQGTYIFHEDKQGTYYNWLAQQFNLGQLGGYSSGEYGGDFSYYKGMKYLYFGPFPAILHFAYIKYFGGVVYSSILTYIFALLNLLAFWLIIIKIKNKYLAFVPLTIPVLTILCYGVGPLMFTVGRSFVYEEAIIVGSTLMLFSIYFALLAYMADEKKCFGKILLSGMFFVCAFGCRNTLIIYGLPTFVLIAINSFKKPFGYEKQHQILKISTFLAPIALGTCLVFAYNYARFDSIFESGHAYQQSGDIDDTVRNHNNQMVSLKYIPYNIYSYFLAMPATIEHPHGLIKVIGAFPKLTGSEYVSSIFLNFPISFFFFYLVLFYIRKKNQHGNLYIIALSLGSGMLVTISLLLVILGNTRRYIQDFFPILLTISFIGLSFFYNVISTKNKSVLKYVLILIFIYSFLINVAITYNFSFRGVERYLKLYNKDFVPLN